MKKEKRFKVSAKAKELLSLIGCTENKRVYGHYMYIPKDIFDKFQSRKEAQIFCDAWKKFWLWKGTYENEEGKRILVILAWGSIKPYCDSRFAKKLIDDFRVDLKKCINEFKQTIEKNSKLNHRN